MRDEILPVPTARTLSPKETSIARAYGLLKIHKTGNPLAMIVSLVGFPTYNLSKWMFNHLKPTVAGGDALAPPGSVGQLSNRQAEPLLRWKDDLHASHWNVGTLQDVGVQALTMR